MSSQDISTVSALLASMDGRGDSEDERRAFDEAVWERVGDDAALMVVDLSGFTRLTKKHGVLHFLHVFRRCQKLCWPIIEAHDGERMKEEADDLFALFKSPAAAVRCALEMQRASRKLNVSIAEDDAVHLCIGIESGRILRFQGDAFGDSVNVAFKLGEEIADPGEVLLGPNVYGGLPRADVDLSNCDVSEPRVVGTGGVALHYVCVTLHS